MSALSPLFPATPNALQLDAFVSGAGTGGTLSGVALYLARVAPHVRCFLVDPPGSSLYNKVKHGVAYASQQCERRLRRHRYDTIIEGVGIDRVTSNFAAGEPLLAGAFSCTDEEAVAMSR
ncbi:pyridoxal-phosphate dependent enzyme, partial [archaeon]